eukprot:CAMPEP_0194186176 /NCGR_PEP_ID=MMETSP0154-20130528/45873_1 /TAXON_ID=1049557 /ORGANISM="Thalassiothrix antarctica, Strain L6-D1" /LENGTH=104 /DNA_ID=CAMNT_0038905031 /DNA_START=48 /DNA_END=358 /DNA_ORIENTATION=+
MKQCLVSGCRRIGHHRVAAVTRGFTRTAAPARDPKDLHASLASLAAYDSEAAGKFLNVEAAKAKEELNAAGYKRVHEFEVYNGLDWSFDGTVEVDEYDAAHLWL